MHHSPTTSIPLTPIPQSAPSSLSVLCERHLQHLQLLNYSARTVADRAYQLGRFTAWSLRLDVASVHELSRSHLERYQQHLAAWRKRNGCPLSADTQRVRLVPIRTFCVWLARQGHLPHNPAAELEMPHTELRLPKHVLSTTEVERVLRLPDLRTPTGLRDRAILEVLYSTGIRRQELINLDLPDHDRERGLLMIRQGKGRKDRLVPIGDRAADWVDRYLVSVRAIWAARYGGLTRLFINERGVGLNGKTLSASISGYVRTAVPEKAGSCHLFRHTMATVMLDHGADIRCVQEILGHASLQTTQIYTRVSIKRLKEVHTRTHPAKKPRPKADMLDVPEEILP